MRWRVDFISGYASFSEEDYHKAKLMYDDLSYGAIRFRKCKNIFDEGIVIEGLPIFEDLTEKFLSEEKKN